jgi:RHS repeat-associated protein
MRPRKLSRYAGVSTVATAQPKLNPPQNLGVTALTNQQKRGLLFLLVLLAALAGSVRLLAQAAPDVEQGMKPYGSYHGGALDQVGLTNGNLIFHADLLSYSQRGGELAYPIVLQYNNKTFSYYQVPCPLGTKLGVDCPLRMYVVFGPNPLRTSQASAGSSVTVGFEGFPGVSTGFIGSSYAFDGNEIYAKPASVVMPNGSVRQLATTGTGSLVTLDGSGFSASYTGSAYAPASSGPSDSRGTLYSIIGTAAEDRNGNQIGTNNSGGWTDTLGRQIPPPAPGPVLPATTPPPSTASLSACPALPYAFQPMTNAYSWNLPTVNGGTLPLVLCYAGVYVRTGTPNTPPIFQVNRNFTMLQSVVFPDNTYWAFQYDAADPNNPSSFAFGDLLKVTFPTGGSITYTWGLSNAMCNSTIDRAVQTRTVDANDGAGPHTWSYTFSGINASSGNTIVTDPLGNDTVHVITGVGAASIGGLSCSLYETQTLYYQGSHTSGTLLKTVNTDYQYTINPYDPAVIGSGGVESDATTVSNVFPIRVTTTLPNGLVSKVETDYDSALAYHGPFDGITWNEQTCTPTENGGGPNGTICSWTNPTTNPVTNYTGSYGKVIATREYDWGQGAPGALLRQTQTQYQWQVDSAYLTANMLNLPAVVKILDGSNNLCAETDYFYDEPTYLTTPPVAITTQHVSPPEAVRGNLTTVTRKLSATPCSPNATWSSVSSHTNWFDTGEVYQTIDPLNHTTTHTYDPAYAGAYPTQTQLPDTITNGVTIHHVISGTYDFDTGLLASFTDQNNQISNYSYDNRWRMTSAVFPADSSGNHPETDFQYPNLTTVERLKKQQGATSCLVDASHCIVDYAYFDGVGRTTQTRLVDPAGDDFVDTTYDTASRVSTVSNPHRSTSSATDGVTTPSYDALGRVTQTTAQDGSVSTTDNSTFPTVTVTDPAGKTRRSRTDALGRLVEVDEPGPGVNGPGTPGSGSINVSGSLYSNTSSGSYATGSVTVSGALQTIFIEVCTDTCVRQRKTDPGGTVTVTVNGHADQVTYGSSASSIASNLITTINNDGGAFVWASGPSCADSNDCTISLQARTPGPNYSLSMQGQSNDEADGFTSFDASYASGSTLTGGVYPVTTYDSGTVTVTVSGSQISNFQASAAYNQNLNTTASAITNALISGLNASGSPVIASLSGSTTILLTAKGVGTASDLTVTGSSTTSFTASSTTLSNGTNPGGSYAPYVTTYTYDPLGNLVQVNQSGDGSQAARVRTFTYDSFSRLLTAYNPESGTICYGVWVNGQCVNGYDADGNLLYKTSPQANQTGSATTTISYCYDALNRILAKQYTNSGATLPTCAPTPPYLPNPAVTYTYDSGTNAIGHLSSLSDHAGSGSYSYDPLGRMSSEQRTINGGSKSMGYAYNLDGSLQSLTYPSTRVVSYTYNTAGHPLTAIDANGTQYTSNATHWPNGQEFQRYMPGIYFSTTLNKRLQVSAFYSDNGVVGSYYMYKTYTYNDGSNNGDVMSIVNNKDTTRTQTFTYDQLNRLSSASDNGHWGNTYGYDAWGSLLLKGVFGNKPLGESLGVTADAQNRLHVTAGADYQYDAAGNMTYNASGMYYSYDQENRITGAGGYTYVYDADGDRVEKTTGGSSPSGTLYWYMSPGIVAESDLLGNLQSEYVFFDGERVARVDLPGNTLHYYLSDHLQSTSMLVSASGAIENESDYYPYGGERQITNTVNNHYKFTGKERDIETGLDYFGARYYSNGLGRFVTPDWAAKATAVPYAEFADPQSLNLYSYVRNIPTTRFDADGHQDGWFDRVKQWFASALQTANDTSSSKGETPAIDNSPRIFNSDTTTSQVLADATEKIDKQMQITNEVVAAADPTGQAAALNSYLKGDKVGVGLAMAGPLLGAIGKGEKAVQEGVSVYRIVEDGETTYVGITNNLTRRSAEQGAPLEEIVGGLTRKEARSVEQALIEHHGLPKNGGTLKNKINSISPQRAGFREAVEFGMEVLHIAGYF